jgi:hypothetical protein
MRILATVARPTEGTVTWNDTDIVGNPNGLRSVLGTRETQHRTEGLIFTNPHPIRRQLPATWLSGLAVALLTGSGVALRLALSGEWSALLAWTVGALFIPALALALGVWTGSGKAF